MVRTALEDLLEQAARCATDAERWSVVAEAWRLYSDAGRDGFDWDFDSAEVMRALTATSGQ